MGILDALLGNNGYSSAAANPLFGSMIRPDITGTSPINSVGFALLNNMIPGMGSALAERAKTSAALNLLPSSFDGSNPAAAPPMGSAPAAAPGQSTQNGTPFADAIVGIESGGKYDLVGPATKTGDRAFGKYQVMGANIPGWTKEILGQSLTPQQFLASPQAQDAVFNGKFSQYVQKYGPEGAARAWFAGEGRMNNPNAHDQLGTTVSSYAEKFRNALGSPAPAPVQVASNDPNAAIPSAPASAPSEAQVTQVAQAAPQAPQPPQAAQPQQQPWATQDNARRYEQAASQEYRRAAIASTINPGIAAVVKARADAFMKQAEIIRGSLAKNTESTPEMKNASASGVSSPLDFEAQKAGINTAAENAKTTPEMKNASASGTGNPLAFEAQKTIQQQNITSGQKRYEGIQAQSSQYERDLKPYLDVSRSILNDPKFYSGIGGELSLDFNRVKSFLGDKNAAMLQEALQKVTASSVLSQINNQRAQLEEAGGNSGRIFSQQVGLVEKAAPALANTTAGNRFLVEVSSRMGDLASRVAQESRDYKQAHGTLDTGFDQHLANYMKAHPLFSPQELSHPETLGAPTVPATVPNAAGFLQWGRAMGLKAGSPVRTPDGQVKAFPG